MPTFAAVSLMAETARATPATMTSVRGNAADAAVQCRRLEGFYSRDGLEDFVRAGAGVLQSGRRRRAYRGPDPRSRENPKVVPAFTRGTGMVGPGPALLGKSDGRLPPAV
jgi:hypothetical protein